MFSPQIILQIGGAEAGIFIVVLLLSIAIALIPFILFCIMVSKLMKLVAPHNRRMSPGGAWLMLIPLFSLVWQFIMIGHIADSVAAEYRRRGLALPEDRPAYKIGLWACILGFSGIIPILGFLGAIASLVLRIVYWVKLAGYKSELERSGPWESFAHLDGAYANGFQNPGHNPNFNNAQPWGNQQQNWNQPNQQQNWNQPNQPQNPGTPPPPPAPGTPPPPPPPGGGINLNK
ncbi:MAG: hypothetical protein ACK5Z2_13535 [Bacteroidota bacterium]|jgi:hypothetical protein